MAEGYKYRDLTLRLPFAKNGQAGVRELPASLEPSGGGGAETPLFRFLGGDATTSGWESWDYPATPETLSYNAGGGAITENDQSPALGSADDSVRFDAAAYFDSGTASFGQFGTGDLVIRLTLQPLNDTCRIMGTRPAGGGVGWDLSITAGKNLELTLEDSDSSTATTSAAIELNHWYDVAICADRSGSCQIYVNGVASGAAVDISGESGSLDTGAADFTIGADPVGGNAFSGNIAYVAAWEASSWLTTHDNADTALERFMRFCGTWPYKANGTAIPTTYTRSSEAFVQKWNPSNSAYEYHCVGDEWLRCESRKDETTAEIVKGFHAEPDIENVIDESEDFSAWTLLDGGDVINDDAVICPWYQATRGSELIADATDGAHGASIVATLTADTYTFSVHVRAGDVDWVYLQNETVANADCYFDLANGAVGTEGAGISESFIEGPFDGGDGETWYRCAIRFTGTAANHTLRWQAADADGDNTVQGDGTTKTLYAWQAQCEQYDRPTSPIRTDGATATRVSDDFVIKGDDGNLGGVGSEKRGSFEAILWLPKIDDVENHRLICTLSDGGVWNNSVFNWINRISEGTFLLRVRVAGVDEISAFFFRDGVKGLLPDGNDPLLVALSQHPKRLCGKIHV